MGFVNNYYFTGCRTHFEPPHFEEAFESDETNELMASLKGVKTKGRVSLSNNLNLQCFVVVHAATSGLASACHQIRVQLFLQSEVIQRATYLQQVR